MICTRCHGRRWVIPPESMLVGPKPPKSIVQMVPCPDCIGGISSCCDSAGAGIAEGGEASVAPPDSD